MSYQLVEIEKPEDYKPLELYQQTQFTQAWFYGEWQKFLGRKIRRFALRRGDKTLAYLQVMPHSLPLGKQYLYVPFGPVFADKPTDSALTALAKLLKQAYAGQNIVFVRLDPDGNFKLENTQAKFWQKAPAFIAKEASFRPRGEMVVKLTSNDEIFAKFDKNTRYSARYGSKKGVSTQTRTDLLGGLDDFYRLLKYTAELQNFAIFNKDYYRNLLSVCTQENNAYLVEAIKDGHVISSKLIIIYGKVAHSLLSGTDEQGRKLRVPSLVQWEAMKEAVERGCTRYSIGGASSSESDYPSIKKVTKYKQGFGGHVIVHNDIYDIVLDKPSYLGYNTYKRLHSLLNRD